VWAAKPMNNNLTALLRGVNRMACLGITAAFPHSPTAGLEIICHLTPLHLVLRQIGMSRFLAVRPALLTTWDWNSFTAKKCHRSLWLQLAEELPPACLEPNDSRKIRYFKRTFSIPLNLDKTEPPFRDWDFFTDGSRMNGRTGAGMQVYHFGERVWDSIARLKDYNTVFQAEAEALIMPPGYEELCSQIRLHNESYPHLELPWSI
jgi:hypothetical protein